MPPVARACRPPLPEAVCATASTRATSPTKVIKAVAASGGVIGLCAFPSFISAAPRPALDQLIDHAVHIASLVGAGHVGLGLDFADEAGEEYDFYGYDDR